MQVFHHKSRGNSGITPLRSEKVRVFFNSSVLAVLPHLKEAVLDIAKKLQAGLDDAENGRVVFDEEVFAEFGQ